LNEVFQSHTLLFFPQFPKCASRHMSQGNMDFFLRDIVTIKGIISFLPKVMCHIINFVVLKVTIAVTPKIQNLLAIKSASENICNAEFAISVYL